MDPGFPLTCMLKNILLWDRRICGVLRANG